MSYISCEWIEYRIYMDFWSLKFCCKPFSDSGGFVPICDYDGGRFPIETLLKERDNLRRLNNTEGAYSPCRGCHLLRKDNWKPLEGTALFSQIEISNFTTCNLKCVYCYTVLRTDLKMPKYAYDLKPVIQEFIDNGYLAKDSLIEWAGGEVTLLPDFRDVQELLINRGYMQTIFTNAVLFSEEIAKGLRQGKMSIVTSVDSGTAETFKAIKGHDHFHRVWENLEKYIQTRGQISIKYVLRRDNSGEGDLKGFIELCKKYRVPLIAIGPDVDEVRENSVSDKTLLGVAFLAREAEKHGIKHLIQYDYFGPRYSAEIKSLRNPAKRIFKLINVKGYQNVINPAKRIFTQIKTGYQNAIAAVAKQSSSDAGDVKDKSLSVNKIMSHKFDLLSQAKRYLRIGSKPSIYCANSKLTGIWHGSEETGTGVCIEIQGNKMHATWCTYDQSGKPAWYGSRAIESEDSSYKGSLWESSGTPLEGLPIPLTRNDIGNVSLKFTSDSQSLVTTHCTGDAQELTLRKAKSDIPDRFHTVATHIINSWWYDPRYIGMGFFLDVHADHMSIIWFHYAEDKRPRWWVIHAVPFKMPFGMTVYRGELQEWTRDRSGDETLSPVRIKFIDHIEIYPDFENGTVTVQWNDHIYILRKFKIE